MGIQEDSAMLPVTVAEHLADGLMEPAAPLAAGLVVVGVFIRGRAKGLAPPMVFASPNRPLRKWSRTNMSRPSRRSSR